MAESVPCRSCGRPIGEEDRFCPGCGATRADATGQAPASPAPASPEAPAEGAPEASAPASGTPDSGAQGTDPPSSEAPAEPEPAPGEPASEAASDATPGDAQASADEQAASDAPTVVSHLSLQNVLAQKLVQATAGEFEVLHELGHGAMGAVYLARDVSLSRKVAIKVIAPHLLADDTMVSRFRLEAQTVAALRHPNIVNVHAVRQSDDLHFFVMEFVDGPNLRTIVKAHAPLDIGVIQAVCFQVGSALDYAHRTGRGVIHRDIKPANIMLNHEGDSFVTDFGISKISEASTGLTQTGATIGTPEYMSPEQCRGEPLTGASDQYALGVVAYEMICGRTPFTGNQYTVMTSHTTGTLTPIMEQRPDCPPEVAEAVERMLAKSPLDRWPDLEEAVSAMGGGPLGYRDPVRHRIVELTGLAEASTGSLDPSSPLARASTGAKAITATSVRLTGAPDAVEEGDSFVLSADVRGPGDEPVSVAGLKWTSSDPSIARVGAGRVEALSPGSVSISAVAGNVASSVMITVQEGSPSLLSLTPSSVNIVEQGGKVNLSANLRDKKGRGLKRPVNWRSSNESVAKVTQEGAVVGVARGSATITAESAGITGTADVVVEGAPASQGSEKAAATMEDPFAVVPGGSGEAAATVPAGAPWFRQPVAIGAAAVVLLGGGFGAWAMLGGGGSGDPGSDVAQAGGQGGTPPAVENPVAGGDPTEPSAPGGGPGTESPPQGGTTTPPPDEPPAVDPPAPTQPAVTQTTAPVANPTPDPPAAGNPPVNEPPPPPTPTRVQIGLANTALDVGETQQASVTVYGAGNAALAAGTYTPPSWSSTAPAIVSVSTQGGLLTARAEGSALIVAAIGSLRDTVQVVSTEVIASVEIGGNDSPLEVGDGRSLVATVMSARGVALDRPVSWNSSDAAVASVDATTGRVTGVAEGDAIIRASSEGVIGQVVVTVEAAAPTLPSPDVIAASIGAYVADLAAGEEGAVMALWPSGVGDASRRRELQDLLGRSNLTAALQGAIGGASLNGENAVVTFRVSTSYRLPVGGARESTLNFRGELAPEGTGWRLATVITE